MIKLRWYCIVPLGSYKTIKILQYLDDNGVWQVVEDFYEGIKENKKENNG